MDSDSLIAGILEVFKWYEERGITIGVIWLHPQEVSTLCCRREVFDRTYNNEVITHLSRIFNGTLAGTLFGVRVLGQPLVPIGYIAVLPEGIEGKLISSEATMQIPYVKAPLTPPPVDPSTYKTVWDRLVQDLD